MREDPAAPDAPATPARPSSLQPGGRGVRPASSPECVRFDPLRTGSGNRRAGRMMTMTQIELWGGVECTVARVAGRIVDQIRRTGHEERVGDLDRFAALGLRTLRYPVLWERVAPN